MLLNEAVAHEIKRANLRAYSLTRGRAPHYSSETEMLSIHGTAIQSTLRDLNRAAVGCPSITGNWSRPVAKNHREPQLDFVTELDR